MATSKLNALEEEVARLTRALERQRTAVDAAQAHVRDAAAALDPAGGVSPFAPEAFPTPAPIAGVTLSAAAAEVRYANRLDVMLARVEPSPGRGAVAGVFTRSETRAAPVLRCQAALAAAAAEPDGAAAQGPWGLLVNAGNANAFTGVNGASAAEETAVAAARALSLPAEAVFTASTGVIGEPLPADRIVGVVDALAANLSDDGWEGAAQAIMTTDTYAKAASVETTLAGAPVKLAGIAKGSGMIAPDMATMLAYVFTDAAVAPALLQKLLSDLTETTFNAVTVDGDTSTSDALMAFATGRSDAARLEDAQSPGYGAFRRALERLLRDLALQIVKDGEGLTKFVEVRVEGAKTKKAAKRIGLSIANSPLVKTAWAGEDPNWGRLIAAIGKAGEAADRDALSIRYGPHLVAERGWRAPGYDEAAVAAYMRGAELQIAVDVGVGASSASVWTCDLTHGYISINADYRS